MSLQILVLLHVGPLRDNVMEALGRCCPSPRQQSLGMPDCGLFRLQQGNFGFAKPPCDQKRDFPSFCRKVKPLDVI